MLAEEGIDRLVRLHPLARSNFSSFEGAHGLLGDDLSPQLESFSHGRKIFLVRHIAEENVGRMSGIWRDNSDRTTRFRTHMSQMQLEAMATRRRAAVVANSDRQKVKLNVGIGFVLGRADEAERFKMVACSDARFEEQPLRADEGFAEKRCIGIERDGFQTFVLQVDFQMVLQVFSDAVQGMDAGDVGVEEVSGISDP